MKRRILGAFLMSAALMLGASKIAKPAPSDAAIAKQLGSDILAYGDYTVFDDVTYQVNHGQVTLTGVVSDPVKRTNIEQLTRSVRGVTAVNDNIVALSGSLIDNKLRSEIARNIYNSPAFDRYRYDVEKPVRIIVDHEHVTLEGVVETQLQKDIAGVNAAAAGLQDGPVVNHLLVIPAGQKG